MYDHYVVIRWQGHPEFVGAILAAVDALPDQPREREIQVPLRDEEHSRGA